MTMVYFESTLPFATKCYLKARGNMACIFNGSLYKMYICPIGIIKKSVWQNATKIPAVLPGGWSGSVPQGCIMPPGFSAPSSADPFYPE